MLRNSFVKTGLLVVSSLDEQFFDYLAEISQNNINSSISLLTLTILLIDLLEHIVDDIPKFRCLVGKQVNHHVKTRSELELTG